MDFASTSCLSKWSFYMTPDRLKWGGGGERDYLNETVRNSTEDPVIEAENQKDDSKIDETKVASKLGEIN